METDPRRRSDYGEHRKRTSIITVNLSAAKVQRLTHAYQERQVDLARDLPHQELDTVREFIRHIQQGRVVKAVSELDSSGEIVLVTLAHSTAGQSESFGSMVIAVFKSLILGPFYPQKQKSSTPDRILNRMKAGTVVTFRPPGMTVLD